MRRLTVVTGVVLAMFAVAGCCCRCPRAVGEARSREGAGAGVALPAEAVCEVGGRRLDVRIEQEKTAPPAVGRFVMIDRPGQSELPCDPGVFEVEEGGVRVMAKLVGLTGPAPDLRPWKIVRTRRVSASVYSPDDEFVLVVVDKSPNTSTDWQVVEWIGVTKGRVLVEDRAGLTPSVWVDQAQGQVFLGVCERTVNGVRERSFSGTTGCP